MNQDSINKWSPFSPEWYQLAFDKYTSTSEQLLKKSEILEMGFSIPDPDGSRSSVFRDEAVLNNSFNEMALRDTLKDIYLSTSHKMMASNHDNVHFFKYCTSMVSDEVSINLAKNMAELSIPSESFIRHDLRGRYKINRFYKRWIHASEILNNWDIFHWVSLLFIDGRAASDYELMMDDRQTIFRFKYEDSWLKDNARIMIMKFDTLYQKRITTSRYEIMNEWQMKMPIDVCPALKDYKIVGVFFNRFSDDIRIDDKENILTVGGSIDFIPIENGYLDLSKISTLNKNIINSEVKHPEYMTIIIPKYMYEYPILLPNDTIYRSYVPDLVPVFVSQYGSNSYVGTDQGGSEYRVYVDLDSDVEKYEGGWKTVIRPIVLSDAYLNEDTDIYGSIYDSLEPLNHSASEVYSKMDEIVVALPGLSDEKFAEEMTSLIDRMAILDENYRQFLADYLIELTEDYVELYDEFIQRANEIIELGPNDKSLYEQFMSGSNFWECVSKLLNIPKELYNKVIIGTQLKGIDTSTILGMDEEYVGKRRFNRPIDTSDFLIMEYDKELTCWTPVEATITHHFPDVYTIDAINGESVEGLRIFKAFFFYSDNPNPRSKATDIIDPTPEWDVDTEVFELTTERQLQDIFIEKFYWTGIQMVYRGALKTKYRWELLEYVMDNPSYDRFNKLFLNTMEEYFKLGMATFINGSNAYFPFDDAIAKMNENLDQKFLGYSQVNNFERYLRKTFIPSYFDYIERISTEKDWSPVLLRRPSSTFAIDKITSIFNSLEDNITPLVEETNDTLKEFLSYMDINGIKSERVSNLINDIIETVQSIRNTNTETFEFLVNLDMDIYSLDDLSKLNEYIDQHITLSSKYKDQLDEIYDVSENHIIQPSTTDIEGIALLINNEIKACIESICNIEAFDIDKFMKLVSDPEYYDEYSSKDDTSVIGIINQFRISWNEEVLDVRDILFKQTLRFYDDFKTGYNHTDEETKSYYLGSLNGIINILNELQEETKIWCKSINSEYDEELAERFTSSLEMLSVYKENLDVYFQNMDTIDEKISYIDTLFENAEGDNIVEYDRDFKSDLIDKLNHLRSNISIIPNIGTFDVDLTIDFIESKNEDYEDINDLLDNWISYIKNEEKLFNDLNTILNPADNPLLNTIIDYRIPLSGIYEYIVNSLKEYEPDKSPTTHSKVYQIESAEVDYGGFNYEAGSGNNIYIPGVGVYEITATSDDDVKSVTDIDLLDFPCMTFRDPCTQHQAYDTTTNCDGICATVKAMTSTSVNIINDEIVSPYISKVNNLIVLLERMEKSFKTSSNNSTNTILVNIENIVDYWNDIIERYSENLTAEIKSKADAIQESLIEGSNLVSILNSIIEHRSAIDVDSMIEYVALIRNAAYDYYYRRGLLDTRFEFFDNKLALATTDFSSYYNNEIDNNYEEYVEEFKTRLNALLAYLTQYETQVINQINDEQDRNNIEDLLKNFYDISDRTSALLDDGDPSINTDYSELTDEILILRNKVDELSATEFQIDQWYEINYVSVIQEGQGYKVGDIIKTTDSAMTLFFIVRQVNESGNVIRLDQLIQYALQEDLSGEYNTESEFGSGEGLHVKIYSTAVTSSTITTDMASTVNRYNDNDMIMFNFTNTRDLDIHYDVFMRGIQEDYPIVRHNGIMPDGTGGHDTVYVNANDLMNLAESSIVKNDEDYFVFKLDEITVIDGGAGYTPGQIIYADSNGTAVKLEVGEVEYPLGTIKSINIIPEAMMFTGINPECDECVIIDNNYNNIDDEFNDDVDESVKRNKNFMHSTIDDPNNYGIGDEGVYLGRPYGERFDRVESILPNMDPISKPQNPDGYEGRKEYQFIEALHIHKSDEEFILPEFDIIVPTFADLPKTSKEWVEAAAAINVTTDPIIGAYVHVNNDATMNGHNTKYRIRNFSTTGYILYNEAEYDDVSWDTFTMVWNTMDSIPGAPSIKDRYPDIPYMDASSYSEIQKSISSRLYDEVISVNKYGRTYIENVSIDDIAVYNYTTKEWEDLTDPKWVFNKTYLDGKETGFTLKYNTEGTFSYEMWFYIIKNKVNQVATSALKKQAKVAIKASTYSQTSTRSRVLHINTGKDIRIRKIFPYDQKFNVKIDNDNKVMDCTLGRYIHYKNELHLEDIIIKNEAGEFMDVMDTNQFEVQFKDPRAVGTGEDSEIQTYISNIIITDNRGRGFVDGRVWGYNEEFDTYIFGSVTSDLTHPIDDSRAIGSITSVNIDHFINPPEYVNIDNVNAGGESTSLTFNIYQEAVTSITSSAVITVIFTTKRIDKLSSFPQIHTDGYIHNVTNPLAPIPREFRIIYKGNVPDEMNMEVIIDKNYKEWSFINEDSVMFPEIKIEGEWLVADRIYIGTINGRLPLINPSTQRPSFAVKHDRDGTIIKIFISYNSNERITIHYLPYPMRSVYTAKRIDADGYIDLSGKLNKPLNKKYFEFWMNGRLLTDEVSIITPTKLFLHGLRSLRNFEIVEINRDPNEYFSDVFIDKTENSNGVITPVWNFRTYLDDALEGTLDGDNYSLDEQRTMLYPVWEQVSEDDENYKDYPENEDAETDIMLYVDEFESTYPNVDLPTSYQYIVSDIPTIGGTEISSDTITFEQIGFIPMTEDDIMDLIREEWAEEIASGEIPTPTLIKETIWYGIGVVMYDKYGNVTNIPENVAYMVMDDRLVYIDEEISSSKIIPLSIEYDLE